MNLGKAIKRTIQLLAGLGLCLMFGFPLANMWLQSQPTTGEVLEKAAMQVDPEAGRLSQAGQLVGNIDKARQDVADEKREAADEKATAEARHRQEALRRFNAGDDE